MIIIERITFLAFWALFIATAIIWLQNNVLGQITQLFDLIQKALTL